MLKKIISYHLIDINRQNTYYGKTALFAAAEKNNLDVVRVLQNHTEISMNQGRSSDGATAFSIASEKGFNKIMMVLISHNETDVNAGWSGVDWTLRNQNSKKKFNDATLAPTGMKWAIFFIFSCSHMFPPTSLSKTWSKILVQNS